MAINASTELPAVDSQVWYACAGTAAKLPAVGSLVWYFPQGHAEQASSPPDFFPVSTAGGQCPALFLCRAAAIGFHANPDTDEVFARILLEPRTTLPPPFSPEQPSSSVEEPDDVGAMAVMKVLTSSDANNGGGFSVPRFCADSIFPPLDMAAEPPAQNLTIRDIHGKVWTFRHIYRGVPRRHLLTTGWSRFVNAKKLIAGDSLVFIKNRDGRLYVGIRRASRFSARVPQAPPPPAAAPPEGRFEVNVGAGHVFSRNASGRIPAEAVAEALRLARMGRPFEVVHYPKAPAADFVVGVEKVKAALSVPWTAGMRVSMSLETRGLSRTRLLRGTISGTTSQDQDRWPLSPWRMLQVTWDDAEVSADVKSVSPWQVDLDSATPQMQTLNSDANRPRILQCSNLLIDSEGRMPSTMTGMSNTMMASAAPSLFSHNLFPAGMQGARHNSKPTEVSKELNVANTSQSESSFPLSRGSIHFQGMELHATAVRNPNKEDIRPSFQLFGQIIHIDPPSVFRYKCMYE
ncbi:auxin response factor 18-like [Phoenix dactylifera]|uniref:Auxin response factor n=1 Tax=Phoenix dactylifera TaxID=42345 RepID=A0A8B8J0Z4_PHODC|nr:auxin response factor 18-like [Phoenix dactylifera]